MRRDRVLAEMKRVFKDLPPGIDHTLNVLQHAENIMDGENIRASHRETVVLAAILHDTGVPAALKKYGSMDGSLQEKEGEAVAREILDRLGVDPARRDRVCFIVGHHHTPGGVDGADFQVLWEADFLENLQARANGMDREQLKAEIDENFRTKTGKNIACTLFLK